MTERQHPQRWVLPVLTEQIEASGPTPVRPMSWGELEARIDQLVEERVRACVRPALLQAVDALVNESSTQIVRELAQALKADLRAHLGGPPTPVVLGEDAVLIEEADVFAPNRERSETPER